MGIARLAASLTACGTLASCSLDYGAVVLQTAPANTAGAGGAGGDAAGGGGGDGGVGGRDGGSPMPACGDGVVEDPESCESNEPWCAECAIVCEAPAFFDATTKHCYFRIERYIYEWTTAREKCAEWRAGADLVSITTQAETDTILAHVSDDAFIGLHEVEPNGSSIGPWGWVTGELLDDFEQWAPGQPDNGDEDCTALFGDPLQWHTVGCNWSLPALCEWQAPR